MAEWSIAAVLKTAGGVNSILRGFESYSTRQILMMAAYAVMVMLVRMRWRSKVAVALSSKSSMVNMTEWLRSSAVNRGFVSSILTIHPMLFGQMAEWLIAAVC